MANDFFVATGNPGTRAAGSSAVMRAQFNDLEDAFDKMPALTGNGSKAVIVNAGGTALGVTTGTLALAGNFATTGAFALTIAVAAAVTLTTPAVSGTLATLAGTEMLSNKTLVAPALGTPASGVLTNCTGYPSSGLVGALPAANFPALTGDVTTVAGALATTLATVATGATTGGSTAIPVITFNNKGLVTAVTTAAVVAPAGTLTGATLAAGVTASSLTSVGTIVTGVWNAGAVTSSSTISAGTSVNAAVASGYLLGGATRIYGDSTYTNYRDGGGIADTLVMGNTGDPTNYYSNTTHAFRNRAGSTTFATINSAGLTLSSDLNFSTADSYIYYTTSINIAQNGVGVRASFNSAGALAISNTLNSVSPTSPNRTITMVVGGVTVYIAAKTTND